MATLSKRGMEVSGGVAAQEHSKRINVGQVHLWCNNCLAITSTPDSTVFLRSMHISRSSIVRFISIIGDFTVAKTVCSCLMYI